MSILNQTKEWPMKKVEKSWILDVYEGEEMIEDEETRKQEGEED